MSCRSPTVDGILSVVATELQSYRARLSAIARGEVELDDESLAAYLAALGRWAAARLLMAELAVATAGEKGTPMNGLEARSLGQLVEQVEDMRRMREGRPPMRDREGWRHVVGRSVNVDFRLRLAETAETACLEPSGAPPRPSDGETGILPPSANGEAPGDDIDEMIESYADEVLRNVASGK